MKPNWKVPFLDLRVQDPAEREALLQAVAQVLDHGRLVMGPEVAEFEQTVAARCRRRHGVGVNSGTDALWLALKALGVGPGDEVITTSLSWIASTNAIALNGATPVFADIRDDLNIDPDSVRRLVTDKTKAILPVHYTGRMCDMDALGAIAADSGAALVEDSAQAFGADWKGAPAGSFGVMSCFSMNPMKVFAACGEAGLVVTDDQALAEKLEALRYNGCVNRETCVEPSSNGRLDTLQAAMLLARLDYLDGLISRRGENAAFYDDALNGVVETPPKSEFGRHVYYTYMIQADRRDELKAFLEAEGIETKIQHPILMPEQPAYRDGARGEFDNARRLKQRILCIPANEKVSAEQRELVAERIRAFYQ